MSAEGRQHVRESRSQPGIMSDAIGDQRQFEGWRFYDAEDTWQPKRDEAPPTVNGHGAGLIPHNPNVRLDVRNEP